MGILEFLAITNIYSHEEELQYGYELKWLLIQISQWVFGNGTLPAAFRSHISHSFSWGGFVASHRMMQRNCMAWQNAERCIFLPQYQAYYISLGITLGLQHARCLYLFLQFDYIINVNKQLVNDVLPLQKELHISNHIWGGFRSNSHRMM